jgi:hypothetical protein
VVAGALAVVGAHCVLKAVLVTMIKGRARIRIL